MLNWPSERATDRGVGHRDNECAHGGVGAADHCVQPAGTASASRSRFGSAAEMHRLPVEPGMIAT